MRKAKIICTLGPSSDAPGIVERLIRAGMDVARLNFSHGTHDEHARRFDLVRALSAKVGRPVAILQDVQGPKIRLGVFAGGSLAVAAGEEVIVTTRNVLGARGLIPAPIRSLTRDVRKGDPILIDDGRVRLEATRVRAREVECRVVTGGVLRDHKGVNLPGAAVSTPSVTAKDVRDLALGQKLGVDYVALSFVRSARDVLAARPHVARLGTPLIAKIEKPQAVAALEEIARAADGILIARGDLGVEMELEKLPGIQKEAVRKVNRMGGLVIVATEMLESMIDKPRPTRAEVSDVANAILDGADAVMLSGETAAGKYPVEALEQMSRIVEEVEEHLPVRVDPQFERTDDLSVGVAAAAVAASQQLAAPLIVAYTASGYTARLASEFRPRATILGLTPNAETIRRMALYWGVQPLRVKRVASTDAMLRQVRRICTQEAHAPPGTPVVIVAGVPLGHPGKTNMMTVHRL